MQYSTEKLPGNKVKISFTAPASAFEEAVQKAYLQHRGHFQVQGFRKGKAPPQADRAYVRRIGIP